MNLRCVFCNLVYPVHSQVVKHQLSVSIIYLLVCLSLPVLAIRYRGFPIDFPKSVTFVCLIRNFSFNGLILLRCIVDATLKAKQLFIMHNALLFASCGCTREMKVLAVLLCVGSIKVLFFESTRSRWVKYWL